MQCEALASNLELPARVAPVRLAVDYRDSWRGTGNADNIVEGLVQAHHLHRSGSDAIAATPFIGTWHWSRTDKSGSRLGSHSG